MKAGGTETDGVMSVVEFVGAPGFGPPPHVHHREDELFYALEGAATFWCDGTEVAYGRRGF